MCLAGTLKELVNGVCFADLFVGWALNVPSICFMLIHESFAKMLNIKTRSFLITICDGNIGASFVIDFSISFFEGFELEKSLRYKTSTF